MTRHFGASLREALEPALPGAEPAETPLPSPVGASGTVVPKIKLLPKLDQRETERQNIKASLSRE